MWNRFPRSGAVLACALTCACACAALAAGGARAGTLADVRERGYLKCGVRAGNVGFASPDVYGEWHGFDADVCRAIGAAVLGDSRLVMFISSDRDVDIDSLASGSADVVARAQERLGSLGGEGARSVGVLLHDSYGYLAATDSDIDSVDDLDGETVCVADLGGAGDVIRRQAAAGAPAAELLVSQSLSEPRRRYEAGGCAAVAGLRSDLAGMRARLADPDAHRLLPVEVGKAPAGPRVRGGDPRWASVVEWVVFALIEAEELGLTTATVDAQRADPATPRIAQFLGREGEVGAMLGLSPDWAYRIVKQVGSYAEIYERNLGPGTAIDLERTRSRLWNQGGMLFAPPAAAR